MYCESKLCLQVVEGREEVNDDACPGQTSSTSTTNENTEAVKKIVMKNR